MLSDLIRFYQENKDVVVDQCDAELSIEDYLNEKIRLLLGDWYLPFISIKSASEQNHIQASLPYIIKINYLKAKNEENNLLIF